MPDKIKIAVIIILSLALIGLGAYSYTNNKEHVETKNILIQEKLDLIDDLIKIETKYDIAIAKNTDLSEDLIIQKNNIVRFKDSLKKIKNTNWKLIQFYKSKMKRLNLTSQKLVRLNDSISKKNELLNIENQGLQVEKQELTTNLEKQVIYTDTLTKQNLTLAKKIALGEVVIANRFNVTTFKERSGKYRATDRAKRVSLFKASLLLNENPIAKAQDVTIHVVISKPNGSPLIEKGVFTTDSGEVLKYAEISVIPYKTAAINSEIIIKIADKLEKGTYTTSFYLNGKIVGSVENLLK